MNVFAIVFTESGKVGADRVRELYRNRYELVDDTVFLVRSDELSSDVAVKVGIKSSPRLAEGAVLKLNDAYSGYTERTLWEWLGG